MTTPEKRPTAWAMIDGKETAIEQHTDGYWRPATPAPLAGGPHDAKLRNMIGEADNTVCVERKDQPGTATNVIMTPAWPANAAVAASLIRASFRYVLTQRDAEWCEALGLPTYTQPKDAKPPAPQPQRETFTPKLRFWLNDKEGNMIRVGANNDNVGTRIIMQQLVYKCRRDFARWIVTADSNCEPENNAEYSDDTKQLMLDKLRTEYPPGEMEMVEQTVHGEIRYWLRPRFLDKSP